jgi:hypothetical protein
MIIFYKRYRSVLWRLKTPKTTPLLLAPIPVYTRYLNTITRENNGRVYFSGGVNEYLNPESGKGEELTNHVFNQPQIDYIEREGVNVRYSNLIIHPTILYRPLKRLLWSSGFSRLRTTKFICL